MKKILSLVIVIWLLWGGSVHAEKIKVIEKTNDYIIMEIKSNLLGMADPFMSDDPNTISEYFSIATQYCSTLDRESYIFKKIDSKYNVLELKTLDYIVWDIAHPVWAGPSRIRFFCSNSINDAFVFYKKYTYGDEAWKKFPSQTSYSKFNNVSLAFEVKQSPELIAKKQKELQQKLENDRLVSIKKAKEEEKRLEIKKTKDEEAKKQLIASLEKKYESGCTGGLFRKKFIKGTKEYENCLLEQEAKQLNLKKQQSEKLALAKEKKQKLIDEENKKKQFFAEKQKAEEDKFNKILANMNPEERRAYVCEKTYGFRKGSDKFSECVYKILTADVELEKIELQKKLAEAQLETARANEATARANESAARARENTRTESSRSYAPGYDPNVAAAMNRANELEKAKILLNLGQALRTPPAGPKFNAPQKQLNCRVNPYNNRITCY